VKASLRSLLVGAGLVASLSACATTRPVPEPAPAAAAAPRPAAPSVRRQTVAVFPFANDSVGAQPRLDFLSDWLADSLAAAFQSSGELRVVERRELLKILAEQKLGSSALASKEGRLELGKIAGAQTMVFGSFGAVADVLQVNARVVDVESGVILRSSTRRGDVAAARQLGEDLSHDVAKDLGVTVDRAAASAGIADSRALEASELFYQGLRQEQRGEDDAAIESFEKALAVDPNDGESRRHLKKLLGASH
jgi:curli biogenesis system outer membrane secretion channel CsgG